MARKAVSCEYCEDDFKVVTSNLGSDLIIELYPGKFISAQAFFRNANDEEMEEADAEIPMNYCPNCGRKLNYE